MMVLGSRNFNERITIHLIYLVMTAATSNVGAEDKKSRLTC
jgi:hypothetical protein